MSRGGLRSIAASAYHAGAQAGKWQKNIEIRLCGGVLGVARGLQLAPTMI
jgi:hypothetical protein